MSAAATAAGYLYAHKIAWFRNVIKEQVQESLAQANGLHGGDAKRPLVTYRRTRLGAPASSSANAV